MHPALRSHRPLIMGRRGAVATNHPVATQAGLDVLRAGGTAVDATIAVSLMLGVVEPAMSGLGGDGFFNIHLAGGAGFCVNATGAAPLAATPEAYRDGIPVAGPRSTSTPGLLAGLALLHAQHGTLPWARLAGAGDRGGAGRLRRDACLRPFRQRLPGEAAGQRPERGALPGRWRRPWRSGRWWCSRNWRRR